MENKLKIYNTLSHKKERFKPINPPHVGMYVCGPTVYGDAHLGHARPGITFDIVFRYLRHIGYKVRYVRNITDVGHLVDDADAGEDKIQRQAGLEQLEPMEVVKFYTDRYHENMHQLNLLPPSIEPTASGHVIEQIELVKKILKNGYAYESDGSLYFDVEKYNKDYHYGKLSGRRIEELMHNTRALAGQEEKHHAYDFALWKKADPKHLMHWPSPWSEGYPGWHLECSAMGTKYLGETFDIHGGGIDLLFPHHESEIAQANAATGHDPVKYWMHNNMITINGQKMGKSLNNFITLNEFFSGNHKTLNRTFSPMTIRFFILQAHYRSTLDFSTDAMQAAEKGLHKLFDAFYLLDELKPSSSSSVDVKSIEAKCYEAMNDDFSTPMVIAHLFDLAHSLNQVNSGRESLTKADIDYTKAFFSIFLFDLLGLKNEKGKEDSELIDYLMKTLLSIRQEAKNKKDYATSDLIRDKLAKMDIQIKDTKEGAKWSFK